MQSDASHCLNPDPTSLESVHYFPDRNDRDAARRLGRVDNGPKTHLSNTCRLFPHDPHDRAVPLHEDTGRATRLLLEGTIEVRTGAEAALTPDRFEGGRP